MLSKFILIVVLAVAVLGARAQSPVFGPLPTVSTAACLSASTVSVPCVAYTGSFTGLGQTGTTGNIALYASNAPAGTVLQVCPNIKVTTVGTGGSLAVQNTFTTPSGLALSAWWSSSQATTPAGSSQSGTGSTCAVLALGNNSSYTLVIAASSVTGTPVWETEPLVLRIH